MRDLEKEKQYREKYNLQDKLILTGSDSHYLENIGETIGKIELDCDDNAPDTVRRKLFELLGGL